MRNLAVGNGGTDSSSEPAPSGVDGREHIGRTGQPNGPTRPRRGPTAIVTDMCCHHGPVKGQQAVPDKASDIPSPSASGRLRSGYLRVAEKMMAPPEERTQKGLRRGHTGDRKFPQTAPVAVHCSWSAHCLAWPSELELAVVPTDNGYRTVAVVVLGFRSREGPLLPNPEPSITVQSLRDLIRLVHRAATECDCGDLRVVLAELQQLLWEAELDGGR